MAVIESAWESHPGYRIDLVPYRGVARAWHGDLLLAEENGVVDGIFGGELFDILLAVIVHGDADDLQSLGTVALLEVDEPGDLLFARRTPGGPEVEHHGLAAQVAKLHRVPLKIGQHKVGRAVSLGGRCGSPTGEALPYRNLVLNLSQHQQARHHYDHGCEDDDSTLHAHTPSSSDALQREAIQEAEIPR